MLSEKRIAEILQEALDELLIDGIADARVLLVHVDEPGGHERAHMVGDRSGRQADALGKILPAQRSVFDQLDDIKSPLVGDRLQPVAEIFRVVAVLADQFAELVVIDAGDKVDRAAGGQRVPDETDAVKEGGAGADDHLIQRKLLHPELLHEVRRLPGQRSLCLRSGGPELVLKHGFVLPDDGDTEGDQLLIEPKIGFRLTPELGAEPLGLLAARVDCEELQQILKILHLGREFRAAVERERDQMPQRFRLGKRFGLLLGNQMKKRPDQPVVIRRIILEKRLEKLWMLLQLRQNGFLHCLHGRDKRGKRLKHLVKAEVTKVTQNTEGLYMDCTALADVTIEDGVTSLPENCFFDCGKLASITLPDSVTELKKSVFYGCGLSSLDFLNTGSVTTLGDFCFAGNDSLHDIVIPDSVTYVGANQFYWCKYVRTITFGANVAYVGNGVMSGFFIDSSVTKVVPEVRSATAGAAVRRSGYVGSMTKDGVNFDVYCGSSFVADGITYMPISATEVQVTDYDEDSVFGVVTIPETITCEGDETVYTVTSVADGLFKQKYNITEVHLPDTITSVGERAFDQIHGLNYINIPKSLTTLTGIQAFGYGGWDNLEAGEWQVDTLYVPASLKTWNVSAFSGNKYTSIVLEDGLHMVGSYGLSYNQKATSVEMASSVQYLKNSAFDNCIALESIELPEGLLYIGDQAFQGDPLKSVDLPYSVKYIGTDAFKAISMDYSTSPATVIYTGPSEIKLGGGVTGLGWNAFYKDAKLTAVLGSQLNLLVERCDFAETPAVVWDGKTSIPAGDYSIVPAGTTITVSGNVRIDGALYFEDDDASVVVPVGATLTIGMGADVDTDHISWTHVPVVPVQPPKPTPSTTTPAADEKPADEDKINFSDVQNPSSFYYDAVYWAAENGITTGYTSTTFAPEMLCTRAQIVTFLWRAAGSPAPASSNNPFTDVKQSDYFYKAVLWAVEKGITKGTSSTTFSPNTVCSRAEVVTFLWRYSDCPETTGAAAFTDVASSAYYAKAVAWATANNITKGVGTGRFAPTNSCSRGEIVTFLYRCLNK